MQPGEFMSFVSIDWTTIFMLGNTFILYLLMKRYLFGPVKEILDKRAAEIDGTIKNAEQANEEANALRIKYEQGLSSARVEATEIVANAQKRAQTQADEIIKEAKERSAELAKRANQEIELEKVKALNEVKKEIGVLAVELASKVVEKDMNTADHERLIDSFIKEIGE